MPDDAKKVSAYDIHQALLARYNGRSQGREGEKWVCIPEARSGAGFQGNNGSCDFLVINTWPSQGRQVLGHEIKISVSDWRRELESADKAERFARYCTRWWVVVPQAIAKVVENELPDTWGLMVLRKHGDGHRLIEAVSAPRREPEPIPYWWWVGWLAQIDRREKRALTQAMDQEVCRRAEIEVEQRMREATRRLDPTLKMTPQDVLDLRNLRKREETFNELCRVTGINLATARERDLHDLARLWKMRYQAQGLQALPGQLERAKQTIEQILGPAVDE